MRLGDSTYEFHEFIDGRKAGLVINLTEYTPDQMFDDYVSAYYDRQEFEAMLLTEEGRDIIAECIFEIKSASL